MVEGLWRVSVVLQLCWLAAGAAAKIPFVRWNKNQAQNRYKNREFRDIYLGAARARIMQKFVVQHPWVSIAVGGLTVLLIYLAVNAHWLLADWSDEREVPFLVQSRLEISVGGIPFKKRSLEIVCSSDGPHFVLRTRLPIPNFMRSTRPLPASEARSAVDGSSAEILLLQSRTPFQSSHITLPAWSNALAFNVPLDVVSTAALTRDQGAMLVNWFSTSELDEISFHIWETRTALTAKKGIATDVARFIANCALSRKS